MSDQSETPTRRDLGKVAASHWGPDWSDRLADAMEIDARTAQRWGAARFPLDARRLALTAELLLYGPERNDEGAQRIAAWCIKKARAALEQSERNTRGNQAP